MILELIKAGENQFVEFKSSFTKSAIETIVAFANSNHQMSLTEIANQYLKTFNLSWDAYEYPDATLDNLDLDKINFFINKV